MIHSINLANIPLLDSTLIINIEDELIDLHNDFNCIAMVKDASNISFVFANNNGRRLEILLSNSEIVKADFLFNFSGSLTLDNFYRGRVLVGGTPEEVDGHNRYCFYFHFDEDIYLEVLAGDAVINLL